MLTAQQLYERSIAPTTSDTYTTGQRLWLSYRQRLNLPPLINGASSIDIEHLCNFVAFAFNEGHTGRGCTGQTISTYIHAIAWLHHKHNYNFPHLHPRVRNTIRGAQNCSVTRHMEPLTASRLRKFTKTRTANQIISGPWSLTKRAWCALLFIWNLLLRVHEALPSRRKEGILLQHITFHWNNPKSSHSAAEPPHPNQTIPDRLTVNVGRSKTDTACRGFMASADKTGSTLCTVTYTYLYWRHYHQQPRADVSLFKEGKSALTNLIRLIAQTLDLPGPFNTHSLRSGAATSLALAGANLPLIQRTGRWASFQAAKYIRTSPSASRAPWNPKIPLSTQLQEAPSGYVYTSCARTTPRLHMLGKHPRRESPRSTKAKRQRTRLNGVRTTPALTAPTCFPPLDRPPHHFVARRVRPPHHRPTPKGSPTPSNRWRQDGTTSRPPHHGPTSDLTPGKWQQGPQRSTNCRPPHHRPTRDLTPGNRSQLRSGR